MSAPIRAPKDFWAGFLYVALGGGAIYLARDYGLGSALKMGPGYFPTLLGGVLVAIGVISLLRSFVVSGEPVSGFAGKGLILVLAATLLAGLLIRNAGLVAALPLLIVVSAYASVRFRWGPTLALAVGLTLFCSLVFVKGLGIPMPLLGSWLGG